MNFDKLSALISDKLQTPPVIIAIDGRCGAGKTTIAKKLETKFDCNVIHVDDFFLPPEKRTPMRLALPGGNADVERLLSDVILPLKTGKPFSYRPYDCHTQRFGEPINVIPKRLTVIEGSYSCHPELWDHYDMRVFVDIDSKTQLERIRKRNGTDAAKVFEERWIPLEEKYFCTFSIMERCEVVVDK